MMIGEQTRALADRVARLKPKGRRLMIAIAGPPGSGKSTLAEALVDRLGPTATLMPMDGFHLDNRLLEPRGLLPRKGAPETFDFGGLAATLRRAASEDSVILPVFDRSREIAIAGAQEITPDTRIVVAEGNYLCFADPPWDRLQPLWDFTVFLEVPEAELERRLLDRWRGFGYPEDEAHRKAYANDIPNARRVQAERGPADVVLRWTGDA
ncbi:nucleoside triphosphate hydrolase [Maliponia aquimaris]|uniref:Pantothenate kinase n=1 Tax=Maliponia aquimaris TaxID=1673631 RepID=A0A238L1D6_9RHOB|nr:nucleoside triphosphate hydrolase [Maliponia aquimaris]SMX48680.1 Pantothenate kinase [Maliponia aquimaris]